MDRFEIFTNSITKISKYIHRIEVEEMGKLNLRSQHVSCIYFLYTYGKLTSKEIVNISLEDKGQVSRTLDYLESNGYVFCDSDAKKRYNAHFSLTEKGMVCGEEVANRINNFLSIAGKGISDEDRAIMYKALKIIVDNIDNQKGE
ncbi:MAG: hypothetical protein MJ228_00485 [Bacilli bacterium]|nr:hypothetical protein [Bacilli bacterium]